MFSTSARGAALCLGGLHRGPETGTKLDRRRFELLKRAYVEARYSANYEIGREDLDALMQSVRRLRDLVEQVSSERLDELRKAAAAG